MKSTKILVAVGWLFWMIIHACVVNAFAHDFYWSVPDSIMSNIYLAFLSIGAAYSIRYYSPRIGHLFYLFIGIVMVAGLYVWSLNLLLIELLEPSVELLVFLNASLIIRAVVAFFIITLSVAVGWVVHFSVEYLDEKNRLNEIRQLAKDAELAGLIQKVQPHFLFNTLNSVNALIQTDAPAAGKMIHQLADFLRGSLNNEKNENRTLENEIDQLKLYLEIEKVRFGKRLNANFKCMPDTLQTVIPSLLLQPLVENAIKFGLYDTLGPVEINIDASLNNSYLVIVVTNPYDESSAANMKGTGFGLNTLERRLYLLFGRNDLLELKREDGKFTATLKIPQP